jgi:hypothetical protein
MLLCVSACVCVVSCLLTREPADVDRAGVRLRAPVEPLVPALAAEHRDEDRQAHNADEPIDPDHARGLPESPVS